MFPSDLGDVNANYPYTEFQIIEFRERNFVVDKNRQLTNISPKRDILDVIALPMPEGVENNYNLDWEMADTRMIKAIEEAMQNDSILDAFKSSKTQGNIGAILLGSVSKVFAQKTPNPKKQALFNGLSPRTFRFDYSFAPQSLKEAQDLEKIIKTFIKASLPKTYGATFKESEKRSDNSETLQEIQGPGAPEIEGFYETVDDALSSFFGFPSEFMITFKGTKGFPVMSGCVCTAINTNYTPQSIQLFESGHSIQINLSLQFMETELLRRTKPGI